jgi:ATP-dependent Clp protease adapter protein ClpS
MRAAVDMYKVKALSDKWTFMYVIYELLKTISVPNLLTYRTYTETALFKTN